MCPHDTADHTGFIAVACRRAGQWPKFSTAGPRWRRRIQQACCLGRSDRLRQDVSLRLDRRQPLGYRQRSAPGARRACRAQRTRRSALRMPARDIRMRPRSEYRGSCRKHQGSYDGGGTNSCLTLRPMHGCLLQAGRERYWRKRRLRPPDPRSSCARFPSMTRMSRLIRSFLSRGEIGSRMLSSVARCMGRSRP
jgi:hypothetical protein